jgi:hypothetical protein
MRGVTHTVDGFEYHKAGKVLTVAFSAFHGQPT